MRYLHYLISVDQDSLFHTLGNTDFSYQKAYSTLDNRRYFHQTLSCHLAVIAVTVLVHVDVTTILTLPKAHFGLPFIHRQCQHFAFASLLYEPQLLHFQPIISSKRKEEDSNPQLFTERFSKPSARPLTHLPKSAAGESNSKPIALQAIPRPSELGHCA